MGQQLRGFTLIEAVICLAIASLLLVFAVSASSSALARADASAVRAALLSSLTESIRHAALTGTEVVLCPGDLHGCRDTYDWSGGWIAYADIDGDRRHDQRETLLRTQPALSDRVRLLTSTGRRRLVFQPTGSNAGSNVTFTLCRGQGRSRSQTLVLSNQGRLRPGKPSRRSLRQCASRLAR